MEPTFFVPVVPTLLLNGSQGIGTGWSTVVHCYHPLELVDNVMANLQGRPMKAMKPWFAGFTGEIFPKGGVAAELEESEAEEGEINAREDLVSGNGWMSAGRVEWAGRELRVTELPLKKWTSDYKKWLLEQACAEPRCGARSGRDAGRGGVSIPIHKHTYPHLP